MLKQNETGQLIHPEDFRFLRGFFKDHSGYQLAEGKEFLLQSKLQGALKNFSLQGIPALVERLRQHPSGEVANYVIQSMTINETMFFRDQKPFEQLEKFILPALTQGEKPRTLRIWSMACSSGQEPYSVAMLVDSLKHLYPHWRFEILATDLSGEMIARGNKATYTEFEAQRGLPPAMREHYMRRQPNGEWQVTEHIRSMVTFRQMNLLDIRADIGLFDIVLCRNVMIYFDVQEKTKILTRLRRHVRQPSFLMMGASEILTGLTMDFTRHPDLTSVYIPR